MKFGSWTYDMLKVDLRPLSALGADAAGSDSAFAAVNVANFSASVEFDLLSASGRRNEKGYPCCPNERYVDISYNFTLRRKTLFYSVNLVCSLARSDQLVEILSRLHNTENFFVHLCEANSLHLPLTAFSVCLLLASRQVHNQSLFILL